MDKIRSQNSPFRAKSSLATFDTSPSKCYVVLFRTKNALFKFHRNYIEMILPFGKWSENLIKK